MDAVLAAALQQGVGYAMFTLLLIYVMKKQDERDKKTDEREKSYQNLINDLSQKFNVVEIIKNEVERISDILRK